MRRRSDQSTACQLATRRRYRVGGDMTRNACVTRSRKSATWPAIQKPTTPAAIDQAREDEVEEQRPATGATRSRSSRGATARRGPAALPLVSRPGEEQARGEHVEEAQDERARDDRRVRTPRDRTVREHDADGVACTSRDDRVDPDAREVGAVDREPRHAALRIRRGENVAPGPARAGHLQEVAADRERKREDFDRPELVEEGVDPVENARLHHRGRMRLSSTPSPA